MGIELQLDHLISGFAGVYDRGQRLEARKEAIQWWEDQLYSQCQKLRGWIRPDYVIEGHVLLAGVATYRTFV
jgi:hypothetical protein